MKLKHFSIRDLLWLTLVVALVVALTLNTAELTRLKKERKEFDAIVDSYRRTLTIATGKDFSDAPPVQINVK